jgi:hypothetical protein
MNFPQEFVRFHSASFRVVRGSTMKFAKSVISRFNNSTIQQFNFDCSSVPFAFFAFFAVFRVFRDVPDLHLPFPRSQRIPRLKLLPSPPNDSAFLLRIDSHRCHPVLSVVKTSVPSFPFVRGFPFRVFGCSFRDLTSAIPFSLSCGPQPQIAPAIVSPWARLRGGVGNAIRG